MPLAPSVTRPARELYSNSRRQATVALIFAQDLDRLAAGAPQGRPEDGVRGAGRGPYLSGKTMIMGVVQREAAAGRANTCSVRSSLRSVGWFGRRGGGVSCRGDALVLALVQREAGHDFKPLEGTIQTAQKTAQRLC